MANQEFLRALIPSLPAEFAQRLRTICSSNPANESFLENFVRLLTGAECTTDASTPLRNEWHQKQLAVRQSLTELLKSFQASPKANGGSAVKRPHDDASSEESKRQRLSPPEAVSEPDTPRFTLHAISTTSPVRKKVDISIGTSTMIFSNSASGKVEATVALSCLRRAFLLPTRGKTKPHWTVVLLSGDSIGKGTAKGSNSDTSQVIFGLDAITQQPLSTTSDETRKEVIAKGSPSLPAIRSFLANLPSSIIQYEPTTEVFKSSVNQFGSAGKTVSTSPGAEAYRAAKPGTLWFMKEGLLWGESKPCEFWAFEDLLNAAEGVRLSPGSGRVFSITLARKEKKDPSEKMDVDEEDAEEEDVGVETELGMVDSRERDAVQDWVRKYQYLFGRKHGEAAPAQKEASSSKPKVIQAGPATIRSLALDSDSEDEDFVGSSSSDDGKSDAESDSNSSGGEEDGSGDDEEAEAEGSEAEGDGDDEEGSLDPAYHPLMRPGAVPKMSRAAMNMVIGMVENDLMGGESEGAEGDEVDELED